MTEGHADIVAQLRPYGVTPDAVVALAGDVRPEHLDHLDLMPGAAPLPVPVDAVVEMAGRPVLYVVRGPLAPNEQERLRHVLHQRGAADHLGVLEPGLLRVYSVVHRAHRPHDVPMGSADAHAVVPALAFGTLEGKASGAALSLHKELVGLLDRAADEIVNVGVKPEDALSLVGRALFLRFLMDRQIVTSQHLMHLCPGAPDLRSVFSNPTRVYRASRWLDRKFNGNLLPLRYGGGRRFWEDVRAADVHAPEVVCKQLTDILYKTNEAGQLRFTWDELDFGHLPVGLLSQVYEHWCHSHFAEEAKRNAVWYTPRSIAEYLTTSAFRALSRPHAARVLDPAVGAGVFLVQAYRSIVAARWRHDGVRPDRQTLRRILYDQLVGFDVNDAALRLAALSLYLTALELDPDPRPPGRLRFRDLRRRGVLVHTICHLPTDPDKVTGPTLDAEAVQQKLPLIGSLGPHVGRYHRGRYDVVLGNPPWTAWTSEETSRDPRVELRRALVESVVAPTVQGRLKNPNERFEMVGNQPDLAFLWRATEWARHDGVIALALHANLLFRQADPGVQARNQVLRGLSLVEVLNGAALRETQVWPQQKAPFMLLTARNRRSRQKEGFYFISPMIDQRLNRRGHFRIDPKDRQPIFTNTVVRTPAILKALFRGTAFDVGIIERVAAKGWKPLREYWPENWRSRGYIAGGEKSPRREAPTLRKLRDLERWESSAVRIEPDNLRLFGNKLVTEARTRDRQRKKEPRVEGTPRPFQGPLVIVRATPPSDDRQPRALLSGQDLAYADSFYGYSAAWHDNADLLARWLLVLLNSRFALYLHLMRSAQYGVERTRLNLGDLEEVPFPPLEQFDTRTHKKIHAFSERLCTDGMNIVPEIDDFIAQLFGLTKADRQVVRDTIETALPYEWSYGRAQLAPTAKEVNEWMKEVRDILAPILEYAGRRLAVQRVTSESSTAPWILVRLNSSAQAEAPPNEALDLVLVDAVEELAVREWASRIEIQGVAPGSLLIGIFAQYRYWTRTRARMLALDLLGNPEWEAWLRGRSST
jgi:N-6 DNA Methylase